jgi:hypothetical protein
MELIIEKIRKIQALAEKGIDGEAESARRSLEKLLVKYGLTMEDLSGEARKERVFKAKTDNDKAVFLMCSFKIIGADETKKVFCLKGAASEFYLELTDYEFAELSQLYDFHKKNINREFKKMKADFQRAYQYKHNLYSSKEPSIDTGRKVTGEDMMRMFKYASEMDDVQYRKAIESA